MPPPSFVTLATHLSRERVLVEMPHGTLMADHPKSLGGEGLGPSAGELVLMALSSSVVLEAGMGAHMLGYGVDAVSRSTFQSARERISGPLVSLMWMSRLHHRLELGVSVGHDERDNVASQALASPLARTLSKPTPIEEAIRFVKRPPREMSGFVNEVLVSNQNEQDEIDIGVVSLSKPEARWRIGAQYLAPSSALGYHDHQTYVIGSGSEGSLRGPTPVELLAGALTSCTVYYVVHNAVYRSMPVHSIDALAEVTMADDGTIASINKTTTVSGDLTSEQMREIEVMANSCYVGESLKRGICLTREVEVLDSTSGKGETVSLAPFVSCDDESCCIPQMKNAG